MSKFTPGEWTVEKERANDGDVIVSDRNGRRSVCAVHNWADGNTEAKARLIAAAPQLLEAVKLAKAEIRYYPGEENKEGDALVDVAYNACEQAISAAEGEEAQSDE